MSVQKGDKRVSRRRQCERHVKWKINWDLWLWPVIDFVDTLPIASIIDFTIHRISNVASLCCRFVVVDVHSSYCAQLSFHLLALFFSFKLWIFEFTHAIRVSAEKSVNLLRDGICCGHGSFHATNAANWSELQLSVDRWKKKLPCSFNLIHAVLKNIERSEPATLVWNKEVEQKSRIFQLLNCVK